MDDAPSSEPAPTAVSRAPTTTAEEPVGDLEHQRQRGAVRQALFGRPADPVRIGRFAVLRRLGAGGMGVVYSAYDDELDRKVAIKLVREDRAHGEVAHDRLRREAQAAARLSHPNVISVFEVGEHQRRIYVAMEFVRGSTLREWIAEHSPGWPQLREIFEQAAAGLVAAHEAGLVHRDFKPDNVMVGDDGRVRVLDFGLAAVPSRLPEALEGDVPSNSPDLRLTMTGERLGTPSYMAPEQHQGRVVDARADQFAFCIALWEAIHGAHPFVTPDGALDVPALLEGRPRSPKSSGASPRSSSGASPRPSSGAVTVPAWVLEALGRGLQARPEDRFADMNELAAILRRDPSRRRRRLGLAAAGVGLMVGVTAVGYRQARGPEDACAPAVERLAGIWDDPRRHDVRRAVIEARPDLSLQRWSEATGAVEAHVRRWSAAYDQACEAMARAPDDEAPLRRRLCLDANLRALDDMLARWSQGDAAVVADMDAELGRLLPPEACADAQTALARLGREAQRRAPAPPGSEDGLISDFEDGLGARFGVGWQWSTDQLAGGSSTVELSLADGGARGSAHALRIRGRIQPNEDRPRWAGAIFFPGRSQVAPANLTGKQAVSFWARGAPGRYLLLLFTQRNAFGPAGLDYEVGETWRHYRIELDRLETERYDVTGIYFGGGGMEREGPFDLWVDDVVLE